MLRLMEKNTQTRILINCHLAFLNILLGGFLTFHSSHADGSGPQKTNHRGVHPQSNCRTQHNSSFIFVIDNHWKWLVVCLSTCALR